jgi:RNA polymerase sigma-70 factor (ECF subfamily)
MARILDGEPAVDELLRQVRAAWPDVGVDDETFRAYLAERLPATGSLEQALGAIRAADLYLACACAAGDRNALAAFDDRYIRQLDAALGRMDPSGDLCAEVKQELRVQLLLGAPGRPPGITSYLGQGSLRGWLRVTATRQALMGLRRRHRALANDLAARSLLDATFEDVELEALKRRWAAEFKDAFADAVASLTSKQRNVLRYHAIDQLTIDQIGALYGVHRVTAFRWVEQARAAVLAATRTALKARLDLSEPALDSVLGAIASRLDASVERLLR